LAAAPSTKATALLKAMSWWDSDLAPQDPKQRMVFCMLKFAESSVITATTSKATALENFLEEVDDVIDDPYVKEEIKQVLQEVAATT